MAESITHKEYVLSVRRRAAEIAAGVISGDVPVLEACHSLAALRREAEIDEHDPDFVTFAVISSETDALPVGPVRLQWAQEALARIEPEIQSAVSWATPQALPACRSVVQRFGA